MSLRVFQSSPEAKTYITNNKPRPAIWDRFVVLWLEQTTYEWDWSKRQNINWIFLVGKPGKDWSPGKNGETPKIDHDKITKYIFDKLFDNNQFYDKIISKIKVPSLRDIVDSVTDNILNNEGFRRSCIGEPGSTPTLDYETISDNVAKQLKSDETFSKKTKWEPGPLKTIEIHEIIEPLINKLIENEYFIEKCTPEKPLDWVDWSDWWKVIFIEDKENIVLWEKELGIDYEKNIYLYRNNTLLSLK